MRRSLLNFLLIVLGFIASAALDGLPRQLTLIRMQRIDFFYLRWVNVAMDILFAVIVLFILWWTTIKNKPGRTLSILFVLIGLAMLMLGSMALFALPNEVLHLIYLPGLFMQFYFLTCAPNNIYFLSYSGVAVLIGLGGLVKLRSYAVEKFFSFPIVAAGVILSYCVDLVHQVASIQTAQAQTKFLLIFPVENLLFAGIIMVIAWWLLILTRPAKATFILYLILGVALLLYKSSLLLGLPHLMPLWYARQQVLSICSPYSFAVTYGGFIVVVVLTGLFRSSITPQPDALPLELS